MASPGRTPVMPPLSSRRLALLSGLALLGVFGAVSVCNAESPWRRRVRPALPPPYRATLEGLDGAPLPTFRQGDRTYVLGEPGDRYNIRIDNPTGGRVEVVVTVDGRDCISGEVGDYVTQRGYLVEAWGSLLVEGFRRSYEEVAAFRFSDRRESYSALRGTPQHVGVIGVAIFTEKVRPRPALRRVPRDVYEAPRAEKSPRRDGSGAGSSRGAPAPAEARSQAERGDDEAPRKRKGGSSNIGTEYGESQSSSVVEVAFERRTPTHPSALLNVRYDDHDGLVARGIDVSSLGYAYRHEMEPEPFPQNQRRFAPPPRSF
jgi:hypothetical protein